MLLRGGWRGGLWDDLVLQDRLCILTLGRCHWPEPTRLGLFCVARLPAMASAHSGPCSADSAAGGGCSCRSRLRAEQQLELRLRGAK